MDELLSRKIHAVLITVSGIQGLETKVSMFIPACISSVLLSWVRAVCTLGCLHSEPDPFKTSPSSSMFLSSPFLFIFSQKCLFFSTALPTPRKNLLTVKFSSYFLMIARKFWLIVNICCFMDTYTSTVTSLVPLHCHFFGLWAPGLGNVNTVELYCHFTAAQNLHCPFLLYSY